MKPGVLKRWPRLRRLTVSLLVLTFPCCSRVQGPPGSIPVSGKVTVAGSPLSHGTLYFTRQDASGSGSVAVADGWFNTRLIPGEYKIAVHAVEKGAEQADAQGNAIPKPSLVAQKYSTPATSGLAATIDANHATMTLELAP
jgi:hypothetical protein